MAALQQFPQPFRLFLEGLSLEIVPVGCLHLLRWVRDSGWSPEFGAGFEGGKLLPAVAVGL